MTPRKWHLDSLDSRKMTLRCGKIRAQLFSYGLRNNGSQHSRQKLKISETLGGGLFYLPGKHEKIRGEFRGKFRSKFCRKFRKLRFKFRDFFRKLRSAEIGNENWTRTFFSQTFRAPPGYPGKIPGYPAQKVWFPVFRGTYRTFWPPPVHVEDPYPTGKYPDQKVWVWVPLSSFSRKAVLKNPCSTFFLWIAFSGWIRDRARHSNGWAGHKVGCQHPSPDWDTKGVMQQHATLTRVLRRFSNNTTGAEIYYIINSKPILQCKNIGCVIAQALFSRGVSAFSLKSRVFSAGLSAL